MSEYKEENENLFDIYDGLEENRLSNTWVLVFNALRDMIFPLTLIYGIENPYLQLLPSIVYFFTSSIIGIFIKPFEEKKDNIMLAINSGLYGLILFTYLVLEISNPYIGESIRYYLFGAILLTLLVLLLIYNFIIAVSELIMQIISAITFIKNKLSKKKEEAEAVDNKPEPKDEDGNEKEMPPKENQKVNISLIL